MNAVVVNIRKDKRYDVYIGRPSPYGNPFVIGKDGNRAEVIAKYRAWVVDQAAVLWMLHELRGKRLGCYCAPQPCHGDVLRDLLDTYTNDELQAMAVEALKPA